MAAITTNTGSVNWNTTSNSGGAIPTAADDVTVQSASSTTLPASTTCLGRSLTVASGGTLISAATTSVLTLGDATAGAGSVAISISSGATITLTGIGTWNLNSTSATQQTINTGGKTVPNITQGGAGSSYLWSAAVTSSGTYTVNAGTLDTGNQTINAAVFNYGNATTRTLTMGSSTFNLTSAASAWLGSAATGLTITANTATVNCSGNFGSSNAIVWLGLNWNGTSFSLTGGGTPVLSTGGTATIGSLSIITPTGASHSYALTGNITGTGTFTATGTDGANRPTIYSNTLGTARTLNFATTSLTNVDFMDITGAGAAAWTGTLIGDRQGNSGITFTTSAAQTRDSTAGAYETAARWTSRCPLPQDDVTIGAGAGNITSTLAGMCFGRNINFTGYTGTFTRTSSASPYTFFGNWTAGSGMVNGTAPNTFTLEARGRGTQTITSNGVSMIPCTANQRLDIYAPGGSYTLADALTLRTTTDTFAAIFALNAGTLNMGNGFTHTLGTLNSTGSLTRTLNRGTSTVNFYTQNTATIVNLAATGLTYNGTSATDNVTGVATTTRTIAGAGQSFGTLNYTVANGSGQLLVTGANTFANLNVGPGRQLSLPASATTTVTGTFTYGGVVNGYVYMPGDGPGASVSDSTQLSITDDYDIRIRLALDNWTLTGSSRLAAKYNATGNQRTWRLYNAGGVLNFDMSTTGSDSSLATCSANLSTLSLVNGTTYWLRVTRVKSTGAVKFYYAADSATMPSSWTQIGTTQTATTSALFDSTAQVTVGGEQNGAGVNAVGKFYWCRIQDNALDTGTGIQLDMKLQDKAVNANTFTESSANAATVTLAGLSVQGDGRWTLLSGSSGIAHTLALPAGVVSGDYNNIKDSTVTGATAYAGANSTNVSNNTGWIFTAPPSGNRNLMLMGVGS